MKVQKRTQDRPRTASKKRKRGIAAKLIGASVVTIVIMVAALLWIVYGRVSSALLDKSEDLIQETTDKAVQETSGWIEKTLTMLEMQRDTIEYENMDTPAMLEYIRHTVNQNAAYPAGLYVAFTDGSLYHASFVPGADYNALEKSWYQNGIQSEDFQLGEVYFDEDSQSYVVGASGILKDADGAACGVAAADVYLDSISDIVEGVQLEETGGVFLVDTQTGMIIGHQDEGMTGRNLSEFSGDMYAYAAEQIGKGQTGLSLYDDSTYIQIEQVPNSGWMAVAYVSRSEALAELLTLTAMMITVAVVAVSQQ